MKTIVEIKESILGGVAILLCAAVLSAGVLAWAVIKHNHGLLIIGLAASALWLFSGYHTALPNFRKRASVLAIDNGALVWNVTFDSGDAPQRESIPVHAIQKLEIVSLPANSQMGARFIEASIVELNGKRRQIPHELRPDIHYQEILRALREAKPDVFLEEKNGLNDGPDAQLRAS